MASRSAGLRTAAGLRFRTWVKIIAESLILCGGTRPPVQRKRRKEPGAFLCAHPCGVAFPVEKDVPLDPGEVGLFGLGGCSAGRGWS
jgi:hypothetical protein